jgi:hypothetical protein
MHRPGPDEWIALIAEYQTSGLSQKEFVAKHDLSFSTFQYWLYRKAKQLSTESGSRTQFLPVELVPSPALEARVETSSGGAGVEIDLPGGVRVRLAPGSSARFIGELLAALK